MIRHWRPQPRFLFTYHQLRLQSTLPEFKSEQSSNDYIMALCRERRYREALEAFDFLQKNTSFHIRPRAYTGLICACSSLRSLQQGVRVHDHILKSKCNPDIVLNNHILNMYGKCNSLKDAIKVFDDMPQRNVVSYTSVISGCSQNGQEASAIKMYVEMLLSGLTPDQFTFCSVIKACSALADAGLGKQLHAQVNKSGDGADSIAQNALITMYTKFNQISDACKIFSNIAVKDLISWGSIIAGFSQLGYEFEAVNHFKEMHSKGVFLPNEFIFSSAFSATSNLLQLECGKQMHGLCMKFGFARDMYAGSSLCDMYARCGCLNSARTVFYQIETPDLVSWNAIISAVSHGENCDESMSVFSQLRHFGLTPDVITIASLLRPLALSQGMQVHSYVIKSGFVSHVSVSNSLLTMYEKCSDLCRAFDVFEDMKGNADIVSWNAILTACLNHSQADETFRLFKLMRVTSNKPDYITLGCILGTCSQVSSLEMGNQTHCYTLKTGLVLDVFVLNGLIDLYTKCGSLACARKLFDSTENADVVSWSSLIVGYAQFGHGKEALDLFRQMRSSNVYPNEVTILGVLTACSHVGLVEQGLDIFKTMETVYGIAPTKEHCSCVVDLLARAGRLNEAEEFISQMSFDPDVVVWKSLLAACKTHKNVDIAERAAENILRIDPANSSGHILLSSIYASSGCWAEFASLRRRMKEKDVKKVPGQSRIEVKNKIHEFFAEDVMHPQSDKIYAVLDELWLQMLDY